MQWLLKPVLWAIGLLTLGTVLCFILGCAMVNEEPAAEIAETDAAAKGAVVGVQHNNESHQDNGIGASDPAPKTPKGPPAPPAEVDADCADGSCPLPASKTTATAMGLLAKSTSNKTVVNDSVMFNGKLGLTEQAMAYASIIEAKARAEARANEWKNNAIIFGSITIVLFLFMVCVFPYLWKALKDGDWNKLDRSRDTSTRESTDDRK